ncbi:hypothetical protein V8C86DRAFT_769159 [Haematococcus lacustris]
MLGCTRFRVAPSSTRLCFSGRLPQLRIAQRAKNVPRAVPVPQKQPTPFDQNPDWDEAHDLNNIEPDYNDPDWHKQVTDWEEFWNYTRWDLEAEGLEGDGAFDVAGNWTYGSERGFKMIEAMRKIEDRPDVVNFLPAQTFRNHVDVWDDPPVSPEKEEENPQLSVWDIRARAEKKRYRELMDIEWRRRQSKVGKAVYADNSNDVRGFQYQWQEREFSHEEVYALITQNGNACKPEEYQAYVDNPLLVADLPNVMGVHYIEETEDFLERIGHLGKPEDLPMLEQEVVLDLLNSNVDQATVAALLRTDEVHREQMRREEINKTVENTWHGDDD